MGIYCSLHTCPGLVPMRESDSVISSSHLSALSAHWQLIHSWQEPEWSLAT